MKFVTAVGLLAVMAVPLMGAKCGGSSQVQVECGAAPGSGCKKAASVTGTWEMKSKSSLQTATAVVDSFDAALWTVKLDGSNVTLPTYGTVLLKLTDSTSGAVVASKNFGWFRAGSVMRLSNPDSVNVWAIDYGAAADTVSYETAPFLTSENVGLNNLVMADNYDSEQLAFAKYSWRSADRCPKRLDRHGNQIIYCP